MKLEMTGHMRMEQRMKLAPHMIQSMEILQLPLLALQERIEQELNSNPLLELEEPEEAESPATEEEQDFDDLDERDLVVSRDEHNAEDFERLESISRDYSDFAVQAAPLRIKRLDGEADAKLQALKNTAAGPLSLHQYLTEQWRLIETEEPIKTAGGMIIDYIDQRGYLTVRLEQLFNKDRHDFNLEHLHQALHWVQTLEPTGVGARDLKECLLIQLEQRPQDTRFERKLVSDHLNDLLENRLPAIAKKLHCSLDQINQAIARLSKLDTSPGLQISQSPNHPITPDVIVETIEDEDDYWVRLADSHLPGLRLNETYTQMVKKKDTAPKTRKYLQHNIRSAQWIMDAIEQRKNTLLKVTRAIVKYQREFFDQGPLHLKPLPMAQVAEEVGVHVATVSRAVSGKYMQCPWGILPLRKFFSGGTEDTNGQAHSWEAVRVKLQQIIDAEDKAKPLSDDQIRQKLADLGIENIARRTVAKYRGLLHIPAARFRKKY